LWTEFAKMFFSLLLQLKGVILWLADVGKKEIAA
jgi:hypothetical protein